MASAFDQLDDATRRALELYATGSLGHLNDVDKVLDTHRALDRLQQQTIAYSATATARRMQEEYDRALGYGRDQVLQQLGGMARNSLVDAYHTYVGSQYSELKKLQAAMGGTSVAPYVAEVVAQMRSADAYWVELQRRTLAASLGISGISAVADRLRTSDLATDFVTSSVAAGYVRQFESLLGSVGARSTVYEQLLRDLLNPVSVGSAYQDFLEALQSPTAELKRQLEEASRTITSESLAEGTPEGAWQRFLQRIRGLDPAVALLLTIVVAPLFVALVGAVVNPVADHYIKKWLAESPQGQAKQANERVVQEVGGLSLLANYRMTTGKPIAVRGSPKMGRKPFSSLPYGTTVRIVREEGAFTLVEWRGEDEASVGGWVLTRYLRRFR